MERPRPLVEKSIIEGDNKGGGMKLPSGSMMMYIVIALIAIGASIGVNFFMGVSKSELTKNMTDMTSAISAIQSDLKASRDSINTNLASIPNLIESKVNSSVSSVLSKISTLEGSFQTVKDQSSSATSQVNSLTATITTLQANIKTLESTITALQNKADTNKSDITTLKTDIATLKAQVDALKAQVVTLIGSGSGGTTTPTATGVTISVNNPSITLTPTGYTNAFNLTITNNNAKAITGGQISFTLQFIGLPVGQNVGTVLSGTPLANGYITWRTPTLTTITNQAYYIGDFSGYVLSNSTTILTINIDLVDFGGSTNVFMNILTPTISGFTLF